MTATSLALLAGCASARTAVVVVVESDLLPPSEVASVRASIGDGGCSDGRCVHDFVTAAPSDLPFSFVVEPRGGDPSARFTLALAARDAGGATVLERHVESGFVAGRTLLLHVFLARACRTVSCVATETCALGACVSRVVPPGTLPEVVPGHELDGLGDAAPTLDAEVPVDAGPLDVGPRDAGLDVSPLDTGRPAPAACSELPGVAPTGLTAIDPDGAGGAAPFDAWCENDAEGGGWTLIAKVDPASTALAYDAPVWSSSDPGAGFGIADESMGDALLRPYWTVPVSALRIGDGVTWGVFPLAGATPRTLRSLMDESAGDEITATSLMWSRLAPGASDPGALPCTRSGLGVMIPDATTPEARVRIGFVGSTLADCSEPTYWFGVGASVTTSDVNCNPSTNSSGGARVCGPGGTRRPRPVFLLVYGR